MDTKEILEKIMMDVFEIDHVSIQPSTVAKDIQEWDSINHIYLIVEIEKKFKIKFTTKEIQSWQNVGDIIKSIENRNQK